MMIVSAPWSFMTSTLVNNPSLDWFTSGLLGNFVLFVIICGGINSVILYVIIKRVIYPRTSEQQLIR
jgi:hypothetical protein